jgi:hypothetical protein
MASRRDFLRAGLAVSVAPVLASATQMDPAPVTTQPSPATVIFDKRFSASRAFASRIEQLGTPVHPIEGDITALWYHDLYARWKAGPIAMAGLTLNGALFCLDVLARNHGMRVVFRSEHKQNSDGREIADLVTHVARHAFQTRLPIIAVPHFGRRQGDPEHLVSWLIVPSGARIV